MLPDIHDWHAHNLKRTGGHPPLGLHQALGSGGWEVDIVLPPNGDKFRERRKSPSSSKEVGDEAVGARTRDLLAATPGFTRPTRPVEFLVLADAERRNWRGYRDIMLVATEPHVPLSRLRESSCDRPCMRAPPRNGDGGDISNYLGFQISAKYHQGISIVHMP